jgi:prepilin-type N-terminal cleavage/methylation domain-containing protein
MNHRTSQEGFTIIELLITLFIAVAFLVSGYQLYNLIIKDSGQARADSNASSVAYDYIRRYTASATSPCTATTPLSNASISVGGLSNVLITVAITCPYTATTTLSKIDVVILYNSPQQSLEYSTYVAR